jgi:uncharacterized FlaG/YvyC family protein
MSQDKKDEETVDCNSKNEKPRVEVIECDDDDDDAVDEEDLEHFIGELQRVIHDFDEDEENPEPGMQARFARTISTLKQQKIELKEKRIVPMPEVKASKKQIYGELHGIIDEMQHKNYNMSKFERLLKLAKLREDISNDEN